MSTETITIPESQIEIVDGATALQATDRALIDIQISTARAYPRSIDRCKKDAMALACLDEETAASMFYVLKRDGKRIEGPSVRLAEVIANSWEHVRAEARIDEIGERFVTATATAMDLQKNVAIRTSVKRRITTREGERYGDDMIQTTCNAAMSLAMRNAIQKVIPFALIKSVYEEAKLVAIGKAESFTANRDKMLGLFDKAGVKLTDILAYFGYQGIDDFRLNDMIDLRGIYQAIRDGETTVENAFKDRREEQDSPNGKVIDTNLKPAAGPQGQPEGQAEPDPADAAVAGNEGAASAEAPAGNNGKRRPRF